MKHLARQLGLGKVALYGWHRPIGLVRRSITEGGPIEQIKTELGRRRMLSAASRLPSLSLLPETYDAKILFLSGRKFWYQTLFCFVSVQIWFPFRITPVLFDDGTLNEEVRCQFSRVVPWAHFVGIGDIESQLDLHLPTSRFPMLRRRRIEYPHLRKLTDLHAGYAGFGLVFDSDMLFFRLPVELTGWFRAPEALFIEDVQDSYGYSPSLMRELAGQPPLAKVNVGLYGFDRERIDWDRMEYWCARQIASEGPNYLQEQSLTALVLSQQNARRLDRCRYLVMPSYDEGKSPTAVLHHYVGHSKRSYFQFGWRQIEGRIREADKS